MNRVRILAALSFAIATCCGTSAASAFEVPVEFSAVAVQQMPGRPAYEANMYASKNAVRIESELNDVAVVEITNSKAMSRMVLVPGEKIYLMQKGNPQRASMDNRSGTGDKKPCKAIPDTTCTMIGREMINNRKTEKWEFTSTRNGRNYRSLHWIDTERRMPIREFFPDGTVTELKLLSQEKINGRQTEKWLMRMTRTDGQELVSYQWYDPQLKIAIREETDDGFVRELKDIKVEKQRASLFEIPGDYKQVERLPAYLVPVSPMAQPKPR